MTEPSGYTALDLIGFTDKGTYDATASYVKNDLVHYYGIWRCLVDDTTGITPVEGANWTLFIGEPTSAIEGIIAPIETNPATNSYAVGRQFIYNDALYEVIVAITAGDALVAYEDDPDNANIQLADPVETQLLDFEEKAYAKDDTTETDLASDDLVPFYDTSAAAKRQMTVANMIGQTVSNPNLIDNPWFTVNQRGETTYSTTSAAGYTADRWWSIFASLEIDDGITITRPSSTSYAAYIRQGFTDKSDLAGKTVTLSVDVSDISGTCRIALIKATGMNAGQSVIQTLDIISTGINALTVTLPNDICGTDYPYFIIDIHTENVSGSYIKIRSVKLEVGSVSTLALDAAPNYQQELAKCQRYFVRYSGNPMFAGICFDTSSVRIPVPINMRATPSVTYTVDGTYPQLISEGSATNLTASNGFTIAANAANQIVMKISSFTGLSANTLCFLKLNTGTLDFSADL